MKDKDLEKEVISLIASVVEIPEEDINTKSNLVLDIGLESLDVVTLVAEFEQKFHMTIPDKDIKTLQTVEDIINFIKKRG